jgi:hypothetical protein
MKERINELAPCGAFCGACPSFAKSCDGCSSENVGQKRTSKWSCIVRNCCYDKNMSYCAECDQFPCAKLKKKIINTINVHHNTAKILLSFFMGL